ncbi:MAG TPA: MFS transporter [Acidimicrobiia bacterium]|jgi:MFS family permease|nr:MFS transporter [Acidimicrobiia bacterium]
MPEPDERLAPAPPEVTPPPPEVDELPTGWRAVVPDLRPLRHADYRRLILGQSVSFLGSMVTYVAVPYQVFQLTRSSLAVGLIGVVQMAAILSLAFLGGALADAVDRRRLVRLAETGQLACSLGLLANASLGHPQTWPVFLLAGAIAGLGAIQRPALQGLVPRLVDRDELTAAGAIDALVRTVGMIGGPAFAGLLLAGPGLEAAYAIDAATFAVSLVALTRMRAVPPPAEAERPSFRRVVEGLRYARSRPELIGTYLVDMAAMFFGMPMALFPALAERYGGSAALGALYAAPSVGAFLATVTSGWTGRVHRHGRAITIAAALWGLAIVGFGLAPWLWLALLGLAAAGAADMVSGIFRMSIWNRTIPDHLRGRLASIELLSYTSGPLLGNAEAGAAAALVGVRASVVSGGVLCVAAVAATAAALPTFWAYDARRDPHPPNPGDEAALLP